MFEKLDGAIKAVRVLNKTSFFNKPLKVTFAKVKSDVISKRDGTFKPRHEKSEEEKQVPDTKTSSKREKEKTSLKQSEAMDMDEEDSEHDEAPSSSSSSSSSSSAAPTAVSTEGDDNPPNKILFVENLPEACSAAMLAMLFQQYVQYTLLP